MKIILCEPAVDILSKAQIIQISNTTLLIYLAYNDKHSRSSEAKQS